MNTYFVSGVMRNDDPTRGKRRVRQEVEAEDYASVIDMFQGDGWNFDRTTLVIWKVTETDRMEAAGQPTLFALPERRFKTVKLAAEDYERRERWRQYQVHCGRLINRFGVAEARKVVHGE